MEQEEDAPRSSTHALPSVGETKPPNRLKFLIANLELEFHVSHIRINDLRFSNRKKIAVFAFVFPGRGAFTHQQHFAILGSVARSFPCSTGILRAVRVPTDFAGPALS